ncbi:MAG: PAS domain S-box protein [Spirulina sp. SIO3F2]|nr:PAS domain S-box protein [Spirulina sp. SIO3F2]
MPQDSQDYQRRIAELEAENQQLRQQLVTAQNTCKQLQTAAEHTHTVPVTEEHFSRFANNIPGVIFQFCLEPDGNRSFPYVSDGSRALCELEPQAFIQLFELVHPHEKEALENAIQQSAQTLERFCHEYRLRTTNGVLKWVQMVAQPEQQVDGTIFWDGLILDVSDRKQTEKEQERLLAILEATPDIIGIADAQGNNLYLNRAGQVVLGIAPQNIADFNISQVHPPESHAKLANEAIPTAIQTGMWRGESVLIDHNSHRVPVSQLVLAHYNEQGDFEFLSTIIRDISHRKQIEEELLLFKRTVESSSEAIAMANPQGELIYQNPAFGKLFACESVDFFNATGGIPACYVEPELAHCIIASLLKNQTWIGEAEQKSRNNRVFPSMIRANPIKNEADELIGIMAIITDISDRKETESKLRESEERLRIFCEQTGQLVYDYDLASGQITWFGASKPLTGRTLDELQEFGVDDWETWLHPDDRQHALEVLDLAMANSSEYHVEYRWRRADGQYINISDRGVFLTGEDEQPYRMIGINHDISDRKLAEAKLAESEERFRIVCEQTGQLVYDYDLASGQIIWAGAIEELTGCSATDFQAVDVESWEALIHPDDRDNVMNKLEQAMASCSEYFVEYRWQLKDHRYIYVEDHGVFLTQENNHPYRMLGTLNDISNRRATEDRLRQREQQYRQVFESLTDGLGIINLNTGNLMEANPAYHQMHGYTYEEFMAIPLAQHVHPDSWPLLDQFIEEVRANRLFICQAQNVHRDGHPIDIEVKGIPYPYQNETHALTLVRDISQRMQLEAERHNQAERIAQQAQRETLLNQLTSQIRNSLDLTQILDTSVQEIQRFLTIDRCYFAWYVRESGDAHWDVVTEVCHTDWPSFLGQHHVTNFGALSELLLRQQIIRLDNVATVQDPALRKVLSDLNNQSMLVLPVRATSGKFGIIACIHHQTVRPWQDTEVELLEAVVDQLVIALNQSDLLAQSQSRNSELEALLNQLQQAQTQLIQSEKMSSLGQMVAGVAHEINNPVSFIHGNITHAQTYVTDMLDLLTLYQQYYPQPHLEIEEMSEEIDLDFMIEDVPALFQSMQAGTDRIREIVRSLRTFSRLDEAEIKEVDLHEGIDSTLTILNTRLRAQSWRPKIQIIKDYGKIPLIECYAGQLNQVFMNIISNAIDALEEHDRNRSPEQMEQQSSKIEIKTRVAPKHILIRITDNGPGIKPTAQARLFDPFFTTKGVGKGTGLGLSISYQIITEKHQGKLSCTSKPGQTTFTIELPIQRKTS